MTPIQLAGYIAALALVAALAIACIGVAVLTLLAMIRAVTKAARDR